MRLIAEFGILVLYIREYLVQVAGMVRMRVVLGLGRMRIVLGVDD